MLVLPCIIVCVIKPSIVESFPKNSIRSVLSFISVATSLTPLYSGKWSNQLWVSVFNTRLNTVTSMVDYICVKYVCATRAHTRTHTHAHTHTYIHAHLHKCTHAYAHTHTHKHKLTHMRTHTHSHKHSCVYTHVCAHTYTHSIASN